MSKYESAVVEIGMPVYNGSKFIEKALESLLLQSFQDWRLIIADNASTDNTEEICRRFEKKSDRIYYVRHPVNIGAAKNFQFVLERSVAPYFMWAAADDIWGPDFLASCYGRLSKRHDCGMAFTGLDVIDSFDQVIRHCPDIPGFSGASNVKTIAKYVWSPEFLGKANLIYSLYRTELCKAAYMRFPFATEWGGDMCFNLAAMSMAGVDIISEVHFFKRDARATDQLGFPQEIVVPESLVEISCPLQYFANYTKDMLASVRGTRFYPLVYMLMKAREWRLRSLVC